VLVLDTHALVWLDQNDTSLGVQARQRADQALQRGVLAVSAISFWETAMLVGKNRISMSIPVEVWRKDLLGLGLIEIPIDGDIGIKAATLDLHGDPADRLVVATCLSRGAALLTADLPLLEWRGEVECYNARN
jgi:PIN domain nuclease of toxin-antitoxin system